ncbi:unnamed protein product [Prunus armeniaca]
MDCLQNPNPSSAGPYHFGESVDPSIDFDELSDYFMLDYGVDDHQDSSSLSTVSPEKFMADCSTGSSGGATSRNSNNNMKCRNEGRRNKIEMGHRVAFRTKSELEVMDDGFKWRKYGKKSVKNSPNPREPIPQRRWGWGIPDMNFASIKAGIGEKCLTSMGQKLLQMFKWRVPCKEEGGEGPRRLELCDNHI